TQQTKQSPSLITQPSFVSEKCLFLSSSLSSLCNTHLSKLRNLALKALESDSTAKTEEKDDEEEEEKYETYEVEVEQPYGLKFRKGRDGGTYIDTILPGGFADKTEKFTVGDRVIATSTVFGTEIWPAAEYGRTMYTIRQRIGPLLMQMEKRYGKVDDSGELTEKEIIRAERNAGFISSRLREIQRIRTNPDLENIRKSEDFAPLMKQFDESFINESAINAIKSLFGFNKKYFTT
ncbi:hypothetical protein N665_0424s0042, partial [Sinapis alba]